MLVQHFSPSSSTTTIANSFFSSSSLSSSLRKSNKTSILCPFFNSESTGFQPIIGQNHRMGCSDKMTTHLSACPTKLTAVMDIHRKRFSQLNPRFKQQQRITSALLQPAQQSVICPVILPSTSRPQLRQQTRSKQQIELPPTQLSRRPNTDHHKHQHTSTTTEATESNHQYITLANLTKILNVLQTNVKISDSEASMNTSISTANSARQRVQQHLQETATRWWKPVRPSVSQSSVLAPPPSSILTYTTSAKSTQLPPSNELQQQLNNLPSSIDVSNSSRQLNLPSTINNETLRYDESTSSTTEIPSIIQSSKTPNRKRIRQEPLILQPRSMRLYSFDHQGYYNNQSNINFLHQQRIIRQT